ncbi:hypothetical protein HYN46_09975 [Aquirhabdus parva]|uniref:Fatty acid desaturase domain-containing protein n=1 Tax=Aquirhabdus parva TaxID=2283318 RepID=A0A345P779_9GAMM|nr:hypothetical protein HYN46_09975 [Aquirhabdus parva]
MIVSAVANYYAILVVENFNKNRMQENMSAIHPDWLIPSDRFGWLAIFRNVVPLFLLLWFSPYIADWSPMAPLLIMPLIGLLIYRITLIMHDCVHYTLFKSRHLNKKVGLILGAVAGIDFQEFAHQHWIHHRTFGTSDDPQGFHYYNLGAMTPSKMRIHIIKPLLGFNLRDTFHESIGAPHNLFRLVRTGKIFIIAAVQILILLIVTGFGRHFILAFLPFVSAITFGLFFSQLRGIAEHGLVDVAQQSGHVRSHAVSWLDQILLHDVNFNFHREHHLFPQCPSVHLPVVHQALSTDDAPRLAASMFGTLHSIYSELGVKHE